MPRLTAPRQKKIIITSWLSDIRMILAYFFFLYKFIDKEGLVCSHCFRSKIGACYVNRSTFTTNISRYAYFLIHPISSLLSHLVKKFPINDFSLFYRTWRLYSPKKDTKTLSRSGARPLHFYCIFSRKRLMENTLAYIHHSPT
jgi:hypothetical protein